MTASKPKTPTASGISRLLAAAGFERAKVQFHGGRSGFLVGGGGIPGAVRVEHHFSLGARDSSRYGEWLAKYAEVITTAGYAAEIKSAHLILIVTAEEG